MVTKTMDHCKSLTTSVIDLSDLGAVYIDFACYPAIWIVNKNMFKLNNNNTKQKFYRSLKFLSFEMLLIHK